MANIISSNKEYEEELKKVLSDHFDEIKQPVSVSLGLHLNGQTVEDVVNLLRKNGINALPYYDEKVKDDLSCFVVDGTGIRSPFFENPRDAKDAASDMFMIMKQNNIETSRALPITRDNLIQAVTQAYTDDVIDIAKNNPNEENVDATIEEYLKYASKNMPAIQIPDEKSKDFSSEEYIYRGVFLGDKPYAITFNRRYRDCAYGTNRLSEAVKYSKAANLGKGLQYKEINGMSYGFVYEFEQQKGQAFYDMAGTERPFTSPEEKQTANHPDYREDYETIILEDRNPLSAIYLRVNDNLIQIADKNGYFSRDGMDWEKFARLHTPQNTGEKNDYLVERMNRQIEQFPTFKYSKKSRNLSGMFKSQLPLEEYKDDLNIYGLTFMDKTRKTPTGIELENASLDSLKISQSISNVHFTGNLSLDNCTLSPELDALDISDCKGNICMSNMQYISIKPPKECKSFSLSCVTFPPGDVLDLSEMKCKTLTLEEVDLSAFKSVIFPKEMEELKFKYNVKLPEHIDFGGTQKVTLGKTAKLDCSKTKYISASNEIQYNGDNETEIATLKNKVRTKEDRGIEAKAKILELLEVIEQSKKGHTETNEVYHHNNNERTQTTTALYQHQLEKRIYGG